MQYDNKEFKLSRVEEMRLWELGFYAHIEIAKQELEQIKLREDMGI